ncbi:MAG: helical backbone metal receptor [Bdellovibrionia bacterium]
MFSAIALFLSLAAAAPPKRIVTLNPAVTEILFEMGLGETIVGTVDASDYPEAAKKIKRVGGYGRPNVEVIIELKPDLVLTFKEGIDTVSGTFERRKIKLTALESRSLSDFPAMVKKIGEQTEAKAAAEDVIKKWNLSWDKIKPSAQKRSVLLQLEGTPLIVAGGDSFLSEILGRCGHVNAFEKKNGYPTVSSETVYAKKFDSVVVLKENLAETEREAISKMWDKQPPGKKRAVLYYDPHVLSRLSPRLPQEAAAFCKTLDYFE